MRSGGTVRKRVTIDGRRVDRITATCEKCRVCMHEAGRTAAEARLFATARGWSVVLVRQRTLDGGETRVWRVVCVNCRNENGPESVGSAGPIVR